MERSITMGKIIHCGECDNFLYEDIDGYGFCGKKDNEVCYCGDKCHIKHKVKHDTLRLRPLLQR